MAHDKKMGSACEVSFFLQSFFFSVDLRCNGATIRYARNVESHYTACASGRSAGPTPGAEGFAWQLNTRSLLDAEP